MKLSSISVTLLLLCSASSGSEERQKPSQRIGDLVIELVGTEQQTAQADHDHHSIAIRFRAQNIGKQALCVSFSAKLKTTFSLEYSGTSF